METNIIMSCFAKLNMTTKTITGSFCQAKLSLGICLAGFLNYRVIEAGLFTIKPQPKHANFYSIHLFFSFGDKETSVYGPERISKQ